MELFKLDFGLVFWMFVAFAILFLILWRKGWPAIIKQIDERANLIDKGVEYAQNAKQQLDNANVQAEKVLAEARKQQSDILREAERMRSEIIDEARNEARAAAKKEMDQAKLSIEQSRKEAEQNIRDEVSAFALEIAQKVVRGQMKDDKAQSKLVDKLLDEIETKN